MRLTSPAFDHEEQIPKEYTCDGKNISPPLKIEAIPERTKSLAIIIIDPDAPSGTWTHWLVWNIDPQTKEILEDNIPEKAVLGTNDFNKVEYGGPCPPSGTHRYIFTALALDTILELEEDTTRGELEEAMEGHILDTAELIGLYSRNNDLELPQSED